jgi:hypothetical protein
MAADMGQGYRQRWSGDDVARPARAADRFVPRGENGVLTVTVSESESTEGPRSDAAVLERASPTPTVAIADPDMSVRRTLARLVRSFGFASVTFASGREYLEA